MSVISGLDRCPTSFEICLSVLRRSYARMLRTLLLSTLFPFVVLAESVDPLSLLPVLIPAIPQPIKDFSSPEDSGVRLAPGVFMVPGTAVYLSGSVLIDQGPTDGLEVLACLREGKTHETFIRLDADSGGVVKAAVLATLGPSDGVVPQEGSGIPARGIPMRVRLIWKNEQDVYVVADASTLVRDRVVDRPYPPLPYVYTGSHERLIQESLPDGTSVRRVKFMLDNSKSVIGNYDEPDLLLASPFPGAIRDDRFEVASAVAPFVKTRVWLSIAAATLPLTLLSDGTFLSPADGSPLSDAELEAVLVRFYGPAASPELRAVSVSVPAQSPRDCDVRLRDRILRAAARAKVWVVPVFSVTP